MFVRSLEKDAEKIFALLNSIEGDSGELRHDQWEEEINKGSFSFGPQQIGYIAKGEGSWKRFSIGTPKEKPRARGRSRVKRVEKYDFKESFLNSNWKHFHDALQAHRLSVLHDILPKYGICAA